MRCLHSWTVTRSASCLSKSFSSNCQKMFVYSWLTRTLKVLALYHYALTASGWLEALTQLLWQRITMFRSLLAALSLLSRRQLLDLHKVLYVFITEKSVRMLEHVLGHVHRWETSWPAVSNGCGGRPLKNAYFLSEIAFWVCSFLWTLGQR